VRSAGAARRCGSSLTGSRRSGRRTELRTLDAQAVTGSLGRLSSGELQALDDALALILGLRL
jgi:hypothetical protein